MIAKSDKLRKYLSDLLKDPVLAPVTAGFGHPDNSLAGELTRSRVVLANTIDECRSPNPIWEADHVQARLAKASRLAWEIEEVENFLFDLGLTDSRLTLKDAYQRFQQDIAGSGRSALVRLYQRFEEHFRDMQQHRSELEASMVRPLNDHLAHSIGFAPDAVIDAAFCAALTLEAHYEEKHLARVR